MAIAATKEELSRAKTWFESTFKSDHNGGFPLSFKLAGSESASILKDWQTEWTAGESGPGFAGFEVKLTDPQSKLECGCKIKLFDDFPAIEWVGYFKNNGDKDSPIISDIQALDAPFTKPKKDERWRLAYSKGSDFAIDNFQPMSTALGYDLSLNSADGRSSDGTKGGSLPFFRIDYSSSGMIGAIGWTGDWAAWFLTEGLDGDLRIKAGMKKTHLKLLPGEEIRTPRMLLMFFDGEPERAHNMFRRLILAHYRPTVNGKPITAPVCQGSWGEVKEQDQIAKLRKWKDAGIDVDLFWIDAGWHGDAPFQEGSDCFTGAWGAQVGNWWPNKGIYPNGLKPIGEAAKEMGRDFLLWFEPERVFKGTTLTQEHPEWLLGPIGDNYLFDLGIPEARAYLTNLISSIISEGGLTWYRQDFNMPIAPFWQAADAPDRIGISEIRHIEGLYAFWDELLERHPYLSIDNCSSGGRRIDIEMVSRSIPLWRSDYQCWPNFDPLGMQCQAQGLSVWVPLSTGCAHKVDTYVFRSAFGPGMVVNAGGDDYHPLSEAAIGEIKKLVDEQRLVSKYFYGDFYPLLSFSLNEDTWALWQWDRPDLGEGLVAAFRRQKSPFSNLCTRLKALEAEAIYELRSLDGGEVNRASGRDLMEQGLPIAIDEMPGSSAFLYKKISG